MEQDFMTKLHPSHSETEKISSSWLLTNDPRKTVIHMCIWEEILRSTLVFEYRLKTNWDHTIPSELKTSNSFKIFTEVFLLLINTFSWVRQLFYSTMQSGEMMQSQVPWIFIARLTPSPHLVEETFLTCVPRIQNLMSLILGMYTSQSFVSLPQVLWSRL